MEAVNILILTIEAWLMEVISTALDFVVTAAMSEFVPYLDLAKNFSNMGVSEKVDAIFPFMRIANRYFIIIAFGLVMVLFTLNVLKNFKPGLSRDEGLPTHIFRALLACVLVGLSYQIMSMIMYAGYEMVDKMLTADVASQIGNVNVELKDEGLTVNGDIFYFGQEYAKYVENGMTSMKEKVFFVASAVPFVQLVLIIAICWNFIKLFLEYVQRAVVTTFITSIAPIGLATVVSKDTEGICKRYLQMVFSSYFVMMINIWFIRAFVYSCVYCFLDIDGVRMGVGGVLIASLWWLALLIVGQNADRTLKESGLSVAQTGGNMLGEMMLAGRALSNAGRGMSYGTRSVGRRFGGGSGGGLPGNKQVGTSSIRNFMNAAGGAGFASSMERAGFNFGPNSTVNPITKNGKVTGYEGNATTNSGKNVGFRTINRAEEASDGNSVFTASNGQMFEIWGEGERDIMAPNSATIENAATEEMRDRAISDAQSVMAGQPLNDETLDNATEAAQQALFGNDQVAINEGVAAAESILPDDIKDDFAIVGAWYDSEESGDVCHAMGIDKATGNVVTWDVTTDDPSIHEGFDDRSTADDYGFSYTDKDGRAVQGFSNVSETESMSSSSSMSYGSQSEYESSSSYGGADVEGMAGGAGASGVDGASGGAGAAGGAGGAGASGATADGSASSASSSSSASTSSSSSSSSSASGSASESFSYTDLEGNEVKLDAGDVTTLKDGIKTYSVDSRTGTKPEITINNRGEEIKPPTKTYALFPKDKFNFEGRAREVKSAAGKNYYLAEIPKDGLNKLPVKRREFKKTNKRRSRKGR